MNAHDKRLMPWKAHGPGAMWSRVLGVLLMAPLLTSCAGTGRAIDTGCVWTQEIRINRADVITDPTARQILTHNKARRERCS